MIANRPAKILFRFPAKWFRHSIFLGMSLACVLVFFAEASFAQKSVAKRELFDGKTLKGWEGDG